MVWVLTIVDFVVFYTSPVWNRRNNVNQQDSSITTDKEGKEQNTCCVEQQMRRLDGAVE